MWLPVPCRVRAAAGMKHRQDVLLLTAGTWTLHPALGPCVQGRGAAGSRAVRQSHCGIATRLPGNVLYPSKQAGNQENHAPCVTRPVQGVVSWSSPILQQRSLSSSAQCPAGPRRFPYRGGRHVSRLSAMDAQITTMAEELPKDAKGAVLMPSDSLPEGTTQIRGYDFNRGVNFEALLQSYLTTGFQASHYGQAVREVNNMIDTKLSSPGGCVILLGYTSNLISSGVRETIRYLAEHKMVDIIVTTAGGIEEDLIKCLAPTYLGDFSLKGVELRPKGINRIGNLLVPNNNYCLFEEWITPILDQMVLEQDTEGTKWTPSQMIARLGKEINHPDSVYYWAQRNNIPVYSPALTDGSLGDMLYFHSYKNPGLKLDIVEDIRRLNSSVVFAKKTGMIILGGGLVKHHICNANLMRNGADYAVYVNTAQEFDGSDAGARPDEAVSWGKIRMDANPVKVYADATLVFPLLVAQTFAQRHADLSTREKEQD